MRTCVGCRTRADRSTLLRVVAVGDAVVPDPAGRLPGRGASVHRDLQCVVLAEKRRAFPRALRREGPLDVTPLRDHLAEVAARQQEPVPGTTRTSPTPDSPTPARQHDPRQHEPGTAQPPRTTRPAH